MKNYFFDKRVNKSQKNNIRVNFFLNMILSLKTCFVLKIYFLGKLNSPELLFEKPKSTTNSLTFLENVNVKTR